MLGHLRLTGLLGLVLAAITACGGSSPPTADLLGLANDRPTFVFFFTEA